MLYRKTSNSHPTLRQIVEGHLGRLGVGLLRRVSQNFLKVEEEQESKQRRLHVQLTFRKLKLRCAGFDITAAECE